MFSYGYPRETTSLQINSKPRTQDMKKVTSSISRESIYFSSDVSKRDSLINAYIGDSHFHRMHDETFRRTLRGKIREHKHGLALGRFWIKKA